MEQLLELEDPKQQVEAPASTNAPAPLSKEAFERRCLVEMDALRTDGHGAELAAAFVRVAAWELAKVVDDHGKRARTDILRQLAVNVDHLDDLAPRAREVDDAKAAGCLPQ